jgi:hypothetical protein
MAAMKGKLWELGPFVLAVLVGLYFLAARLRQPPRAPVEASAVGAPRTGLEPRASAGAGDPTRPEDFLPDAHSQPDPKSLPDPVASTATRRAAVKR